jgi:hypothetical protein
VRDTVVTVSLTSGSFGPAGQHVVTTGARAPCLGMMTFTDLASVPANDLAPVTGQLRLAVAAYLARVTGSSREHTD